MNTKGKIPMMALAVFLLFSCSEERLINEPGNLVPKTVDLDPGLPSITVDDALLHSEATGPADSTLIICIHGGPGGDYRNLLNCGDLADHGYRVVFYDQRGSGLSQRFSKESYSSLGMGALDLMYDELSGVIAHYRTSQNQKVYLIGHSWGAMLATGYAGKFPTAIQGLVVCEPGGLEYDDIADFNERSRSFNFLGELLNNASYLDQFITGKEDQHEILDYKLAMLASKNDITGEDLTLPGSFWRWGAVIMDALLEIGDKYEPDLSEGISNFNVPVLFFYSEKNEAYTDSWAQKISGAYNTVELVKVMGVGHNGIINDLDAWTNVTLPEILTYFNSLEVINK
jgi:proline iminopeptidase